MCVPADQSDVMCNIYTYVHSSFFLYWEREVPRTAQGKNGLLHTCERLKAASNMERNILITLRRT
jgi:hypothetical protein